MSFLSKLGRSIHRQETGLIRNPKKFLSGGFLKEKLRRGKFIINTLSQRVKPIIQDKTKL